MADQVQNRIDLGTMDIGFLLEPVHVDKYDSIRLPVKERLGVLMGSDDPLLKKDSIEPENLLGFPVVLSMRKELKKNTRNILGTVYDRFDVLAIFDVVNNATLLAENKTARIILVESEIKIEF